MKANERRKLIVKLLLAEGKAIPGAALAERFSLSRQVIVQDIATLRSQGYDIISTHFGYVLHESPLPEKVFKLKHTAEDTEDELRTIVSLGGTVVDVFVWHKVYGKISAQLNIFSEAHIDQFLEGVKSGKSSELMHVTGGYHYHTVRADTAEVLEAITKALTEKGYVVEEEA